jgi:1,5-anhydro-D-fructose reductase (1,5-anhydro-D-mannitol-forming)
MHRRGDTVVVIYGTDQDWTGEFARAYGIGAVADTMADLGRHEIDAVYVAGKNQHHHQRAMAAIEAGRHVLCEKPVALSLADMVEMVEAAETAGLVFAVNHHLPGAATHRLIRETVFGGAIGRPLAVRVGHAVLLPERLRGWRLHVADGGGVGLDVTSHSVSAVQSILGTTARTATATGVRQSGWDLTYDAMDALMGVLEFDNDVIVQTHDAFTVEFSPTSIEIIGTEGTVLGESVMTQDPIGSVRLRDRRVRELEVRDRRDLYSVILDAFAASIAGDGRPTVDGWTGVAATATALAVERAAVSGRRLPVEARAAVAGS